MFLWENKGRGVTETTIIALVFAALLALEWRYRNRLLRVGTACLALAYGYVTLPDVRRAAWRAVEMPPVERVGHLGDPESDYVRGIATMERAVLDEQGRVVEEQLVSVGVLLWLACSPAFRRAPAVSAGHSVRRAS